MTPNKLAVSYEDIISASNVLKGIAHRTAVLTSHQADAIAKAKLFFKCENFQRVGAFKFRGAYNAISKLSEEQKRRGVVAFSSGNHAQAVTLAARMLNVPATIADGAQTQQVGKLTFPILQAHVNDIVTVTDAQLCAQMRFFAERMKMIVEPTGCLAAAAVMHNVVDVSSARVGVIVSGGNVDMDMFSNFIRSDYPI